MCSSDLGAGTGAATGAAPISSVSTAGATSGATGTAAAPITTSGVTGASGAGVGGTAADMAAQNALMGDISRGISYQGSELATQLTPTQVSAGQMAGAGPVSTPTFPSVNQFYAKNPILMPAGLGATTAAIGQTYDQEGLPEEEKYRGPLSRFSYNPDRYRPAMASGGLADTAVAQRYMKGGHLGSYSDGGRLLKGPGDGMSDSIPAKIGAKQPARLADGEFVVPADVVSGLGNGSTDAGARKLYAMMDKVRKSRTGTKRQGKEINSNKYLPA